MRTVLKFKLSKETKGALQFKEVETDGSPTDRDYAVGTLYVRKAFFTSLPQELQVTVECTDG